MAKIIDGRAIARTIREQVRDEVQSFRRHGRIPGLAVILVGKNPSSEVYVNMKAKACEETGIHSITDQLDSDISENELLDKIADYNQNPQFHGLLVQLPLPAHINEQKIIESIAPRKDVDCFHPYNVGKLMVGQSIFEPATPAGIIEILRQSKIDPSGKHVVILGRSNIVGKPLSMMLIQKRSGANAVVTVVHTGAEDITKYTLNADILVAAMGKAEIVKADMVKEGVVVIDVGVNRVESDNEKGYRLAGDVDFDDILPKAAAITPVPGGVGPMTIAMLLRNTMKAFRLQEKNIQKN
ncbi:MAG: bifunctional methylenetetrahydrofolate dehydrogenase/methenyltetrahydrofolate cyclohydrolase FolD [Calditrichaeota bacterium]|nr:bifunctional methylenetetrahydrofolate dehydrogenase/methenyltetrahydrofolate cyclohydrolase FolD [Calditrichota bacterium]RQW02755.1 MAG: bifunctional methylenetetrahydrofolate dehydrogenase/methenyltetrahydrofolate cyclohydrolase FolD [Calditrichota bacterium]